MTQRYQTLTPEDIVAIVKAREGLTEDDPKWCTAQGIYYGGSLGAYVCPPDAKCEDCLRRWLEEEVKPDPVWYSKEFVMEQVAALIEHDESGLSLFHILDEVLADTPEQIRYGSVDAYLEAMEEKA